MCFLRKMQGGLGGGTLDLLDSSLLFRTLTFCPHNKNTCPRDVNTGRGGRPGRQLLFEVVEVVIAGRAENARPRPEVRLKLRDNPRHPTWECSFSGRGPFSVKPDRFSGPSETTHVVERGGMLWVPPRTFQWAGASASVFFFSYP